MGAGSESIPNLPESQPEAGPLPEVIVQQVQLPAGVAGPPTEISFDVRCFVLPVSGGIVLIDTGMGGSAVDINQVLERLGAGWGGDVSDVVLTHSHADHVGGLDDVLSRAGGDALLWAGEAELSALLPTPGPQPTVLQSAGCASSTLPGTRKGTSVCCMKVTACCSSVMRWAP